MAKLEALDFSGLGLRQRVDELDAADGEVLAIPRILGDPGELGGDAVVIEDLSLGTGSRIDDVEELAVRSLPFIPEPLAALDPARLDRRTMYQTAYSVRRKTGRKFIVGLDGIAGGLGRGRDVTCKHECE